MGTVALVQDHRIEVKATDGKTVTITTTSRTKVTHDRTVMKASDIHVGDRVVITATEKKDGEGKTTLTASEVRLGAPAAKGRKPAAARS
jgi:hypothetical protein